MIVVMYIINIKGKSNYLCMDLIQSILNDNIFIKDLRTKHSFEGTNFVRIAIKSTEDNDKLIEAIKNYLKNNK